MKRPAPPSCSLHQDGRAEVGPFVRAEDAGPARWPTTVALALRNGSLVLRFDCVDPDPWGTLTRRDDPLWTEEVVEVFLAPGSAAPARYFELEVSPLGTVFDALVVSPHGDRRELSVDPGWDCAGLETRVSRREDAARWIAELAIPLRVLAPFGIPDRWRLNLYRIERPRDGSEPEYSAWSPTFVSPADFHRPVRFGHLLLRR